MKRVSYVLLLVLFAGLASCGVNASENSRTAMESWIGSSKQKLLLQWGPLTYIYSDGAGGEILSYEQTTASRGSSMYMGYGITSYQPPQQQSWYRQFYVNPSGNIYYARWNY